MNAMFGVGRQKSDHLPNQGSQFLQAGAPSDNDDDGDRELLDVLLELETPVNRDEGSEAAVRGKAQEAPVQVARPTHLPHRVYLEGLGERRPESPWDGFVE